MKKIIIYCIALAIIIGCNTNKSFVSEILNDNNLTLQEFSINPSIENKIKSKEGIEFIIPPNAFNTNESSIDIVVKEALTINDIIKAKLTTQSKDGLLSSDGMFYFGTKKDVQLTKEIVVKLPTNNYNSNMQLFKGNKVGDNIIWENPKPILQNPEVPNSEQLFIKNCASCHALDKKLTGPPLAYVEERFSNRQNLIEYIQNNQKFMAWHYYEKDTLPKGIHSINDLQEREKDVAYARFLYCVYGKTAMNVFDTTVLKEQELISIINYIKQESKKYPNPYNRGTFENCLNVYKELELIVQQKDSLEALNIPRKMVEVTNMQPTIDTAGTLQKVTIEKFDANEYIFSIDATGWYNIDEFLRKENTLMSNLTVELNQDTLNQKEVFLAVPSYKIFAQGGLINKTQYSFFENNSGSLPLPQGVKAYAIVFGESNKQLYFGIQEFITSTTQNIKVNVQITDKSSIEKTINNLKLSDLNLKIEKNDIPKQIDSLNKIIEFKYNSLSQSNCECFYEFLK